jgi:hypothetical protein
MAVKPLNAAQQPRWCVQWHEAINFVAFDHPAGQISPHLDIDSWETTAHEELEAHWREGEGRIEIARKWLITAAATGKISVLGVPLPVGALLNFNEQAYRETYKPLQLIPRAFWQDGRFEISEEVERQMRQGIACAAVPIISRDSDCYFWPVIPVQDLVAEFGYPPSHFEYLRTRRRRPGRPGTYDWQEFAAEIAARAAAGQLPATRAQCAREMGTWCLKWWGIEPPFSQIEEWVGTAYTAIEKKRVQRAAIADFDEHCNDL